MFNIYDILLTKCMDICCVYSRVAERQLCWRPVPRRYQNTVPLHAQPAGSTVAHRSNQQVVLLCTGPTSRWYCCAPVQPAGGTVAHWAPGPPFLTLDCTNCPASWYLWTDAAAMNTWRPSDQCCAQKHRISSLQHIINKLNHKLMKTLHKVMALH